MTTKTSASERRELAALARHVAAEAAEIVSAGYRSRPRAEAKHRHDLVTEFDRASQERIVSRLRALTPAFHVVAEETLDGDDGLDVTRDDTAPTWFVDPLDGTTNFVHGHPFWSVAIGLLDGGEPVVGVVVAPRLGLEWIGWRGDPGSSDAGQVLRSGERCAVSATHALTDAMIGTGFPPARDVHPENNFAAFVSVKRVARAVRRCGSASIDLCLVADGTYDGYWERMLKPWDIVGGSALVLAAGGRVTALDGGHVDYVSGRLVASNGIIHDELVRAVAAEAGDPRL